LNSFLLPQNWGPGGGPPEFQPSNRFIFKSP
jgi:hypothetical protein